MKTYLVAALALALAIGTVPAMAKSDSGGGGGSGSGHSSSAGSSANRGGTPTGEFLAGGINHQGLRDTGTDQHAQCGRWANRQSNAEQPLHRHPRRPPDAHQVSDRLLSRATRLTASRRQVHSIGQT